MTSKWPTRPRAATKERYPSVSGVWPPPRAHPPNQSDIQPRPRRLPGSALVRTVEASGFQPDGISRDSRREGAHKCVPGTSVVAISLRDKALEDSAHLPPGNRSCGRASLCRICSRNNGDPISAGSRGRSRHNNDTGQSSGRWTAITLAGRVSSLQRRRATPHRRPLPAACPRIGTLLAEKPGRSATAQPSPQVRVGNVPRRTSSN